MLGTIIAGGIIAMGVGSTYYDSVDKHSLSGKISLIWKRINLCVEDPRSKKKYYPKIIKQTWEGDNPVFYVKLPEGLSYFIVKKNIHFLMSGLKADIGLKFLDNDPNSDMKLIIYNGMMKEGLVYDFNEINKRLKKTGFHAPIGFSKKGLEQIDFTQPNSPHMVWGGETGTGKTSGIRMLGTHICLTHNPNEARFWLADLKDNTEFDIFRQTMFCDKSIGRPQDAEAFFEELINEQYSRLARFKQYDCVRIDRYNEKSTQKMHRIFVLIDELSLLMGNDYKKVREQLLTQITAFGRATGVHLVIGTHRTDAQVMSGQMKENITTIVAFPCNPISARVLLGEDQAEMMKLIDSDIQGRALFFHRNVSEIQVPFLDEDIASEILAPYKIPSKPQNSQSLVLVKST